MVLKMPFSNALVPLHRLFDIWQSAFDEVLFFASRGESEKNVLKEQGCAFFFSSNIVFLRLVYSNMSLSGLHPAQSVISSVSHFSDTWTSPSCHKASQHSHTPQRIALTPHQTGFQRGYINMLLAPSCGHVKYRMWGACADSEVTLLLFKGERGNSSSVLTPRLFIAALH